VQEHRENLETSQQYRELLSDLVRALPSQSEGSYLKQSLLAYSLDAGEALRPEFFMEAMDYFADDPQDKGLPEPQVTDAVIAWTWRTQRVRFLGALRALILQNSNRLTKRLLEGLSHVAEVDDLMVSLSDWLEARRAVVRSNPDLLQWDRLLQVPSAELLMWLDDVSQQEVIKQNLIPRLPSTPSPEVAESLCKRYPSDVLRALCVREYLGSSQKVNSRILIFAGEAAPRFLKAESLASLNTTTALCSFGSMLGLVNSRTIAAGSVIWMAALKNAVENSTEAQRQVLRAFLIGLALANPEHGSEFVFEYSFDLLHRAMEYSCLDYQASVILEGELPEVSWWRRWDMCYRLRLGVVKAFVRGNLNPASFVGLTKDSKIMGEMFEILESLDGARSYLDRVKHGFKSNNRRPWLESRWTRSQGLTYLLKPTLNPIHSRCRLLSKIIGDMEHEYHEEQKAGENFQKLARGVL